jgi:hypothetical protein
MSEKPDTSADPAAPPNGSTPSTSEERAYAFVREMADRLGAIVERTRGTKEAAEPAVDVRVIWHRAYMMGRDEGERLAQGYLEQLIDVGAFLLRAGVITEAQVQKHGVRNAVALRFEPTRKPRKARKPAARRARR